MKLIFVFVNKYFDLSRSENIKILIKIYKTKNKEIYNFLNFVLKLMEKTLFILLNMEKFITKKKDEEKKNDDINKDFIKFIDKLEILTSEISNFT
jgi:hypothetical protein